MTLFQNNNVHVFLLFCIFCFVNAGFVHRKSRVPGVTRILKGFIRSDPIKDDKGLDTDFRRVADVTTKLFSDVVIYEETEEADFRVISCRYVWKRGYYAVSIKGRDTDKADFDAGTKFIIRRKTWLELCPNTRLPPKARSRFEKVLFFNILSSTELSKTKLKIAMVPTWRKKVIGRVRFSVRNEVFDKQSIKKRVNFEKNDDDLGLSRVTVVSKNLSMSTSSRASASFDEAESIAITDDITATVSVSASVGIENLEGDFDIFSLSGGISFETFLSASATAKLAIEAKDLAEYTDEIFSVPIPSLSYTISIPFGEDLSVGAFFALDFVASLEAELLATYTASVAFEKRVKVSLDLIPDASASADVLEKSGSGDSSLETTTEAELGAKITGFVGVKPAVGLQIDLGEFGSGALEAFIQAGVEASIKASDTPFSPVTTGITFGVCESCHYVQGGLSVVGRDLSVGYDVNEETDSIVLESVPFAEDIGTVCAITATCDSE